MHKSRVKVVDKGFRTFWVFVTYLLAILVPKLELMIPLVGGRKFV